MDVILDEPTNNLGLTGNFQIFLDQFLVSKDNGTADTLFDYDKYRNERSYGKTLELRQNLYTVIAKTNLDKLNQNEKVAFLINTYNFFAIEMVSNNYFTPTGKRLESISNIAGVGSFKAFDLVDFNVAGKDMSLNDIEKKTLVPLVTFNNGGVDARIHFAVICAANGCPILMKTAYAANTVQAQLTEATVEGLKLKRNLDVEKVKLTELFNWYQSDFANHSEIGNSKLSSHTQFIAKYTEGVDASIFETFRAVAYDWTVNKVKNRSDIAGDFYSNMQTFLDSYVSYIGSSQDTLVDYNRLFAEKESDEVLALRDSIYDYLANIDLNSLEKDEKVALLTNAYNFFAIEIVIKNYKLADGSILSSISDIGGDNLFKAFKSKEFNIGGETLSLDDIEKGTLVPILKFSNGSVDARVHFTVICAAKGCPILKKQAYLPSLIDVQYTNATVDGLREARNFNIVSNEVALTQLFDWYKTDFENHSTDGQSVVTSREDFLKLYIDGLQLDSVGEDNYIEYDWELNRL
jgi:hypothetical protein